MQNNPTYKIYTTNLTHESSIIIEIETIILNGLYRFSILGISQKNSSDTKDRIYSALRSQKLMNLKSDNKKITVNLLPTNIDKKTNIYDLGIAISCLVHMNQIQFNENILVIGELSIVGNIIPSNFILKSIYQAIQNNITCIVCSRGDLEILNTYPNYVSDEIHKNKLKFIVADTLGELIQNIKNNNFYVFKNDQNNIIYKATKQHMDLSDENVFKILLAICTNRNIFIENKKESYIKKFLKNLTYYTCRLNSFEILNISNVLSTYDRSIMDMFVYPKISTIDNQTQKDDLLSMIDESYFGFNVIENFISVPEDILYIIKKLHKSSIICFYNSCPCGNSNNLFNSFHDDKCLCLQRYILRYRQKLRVLENGFFDFYIQNIDNTILEYKPEDYMYINDIIRRFRNNRIEIEQVEQIDQIISTLNDYYEQAELDLIINLAKDITKLKYIIDETKKPIVAKDTIDLAVKLLKKDF